MGTSTLLKMKKQKIRISINALVDKRTIIKNVISEYFGIKFYMFKAKGAPLQEQENDI